MKNTCPCIIFQVLKVLLYENLQVRYSHQIFCFLLLLLAFTSSDIIFHTFLELHSTLSEKKIFVTNFPFLKDSLKPPTPLKVTSATKQQLLEPQIKIYLFRTKIMFRYQDIQVFVFLTIP